MSRFAAYTVFSAFVIACRLAMCPTRRLPASVTATIEGVVLYPPRFGMTIGLPFSTIATHEFVVPRAMPITFPIRGSPVRSERLRLRRAREEQRAYLRQRPSR